MYEVLCTIKPKPCFLLYYTVCLPMATGTVLDKSEGQYGTLQYNEAQQEESFNEGNEI